MLIGEVIENNSKGKQIKKVSYTRIPLRLGFEVFGNGEISEKKKKEFTKSIKAFKLISEVFEVKELRACATSAMRNAKNGKAIRDYIEKQTGVSIEIIDGKEEADIIFSNFSDRTEKDDFLVIDVGGGSTEISVFQNNSLVASKSFKLGTIRILQDKVPSTEWDTLESWLKKNIDRKEKFDVIGTGGNINKIHKLLGKKSTEQVKVDELSDLYKELKSLSLEKRITKFKLKPDRADVIIPATKIFLKVCDELKIKELEVPKIGLSDGIIFGLDKKHRSKKK
ncbi:MAG: exopolyphosphatase [Crocinitomicaceae bacterium]|nr:exopolyphosphatase [Crocinitomicaceae bacterium]